MPGRTRRPLAPRKRGHLGAARAILVGLAIAAPMALCAIVLLWRPWVPVLDLAMTEMRVRDVGSANTPLVGSFGRFGTFPNPGAHPGPWSFYLIAVVYRLTGSSAWSMEFASVVINTICLVLTGVLLTRRFGHRGLAMAALGGAIMVRGYGMTVLTQPWNPYVPVLIWLLAVVAAWLVLDGNDAPLPLVVAASIVAAQCHVAYLVPSLVIDGVLIAVVGTRIWRRRARGVATPASADASTRHLIAAIAVGAAMWVPPLVEEFRHRPGNISALITYFTGRPAEPLIGFRGGFGVLTQHLNLVALLGELIGTDHAFITRASGGPSISAIGSAVLGLWVLAGVWSMRRGRHATRIGFALTALLLVTDWFIIARIAGQPWFYLTLWMPTTAAFVVATTISAVRDAVDFTPSRRREAESPDTPQLGTRDSEARHPVTGTRWSTLVAGHRSTRRAYRGLIVAVAAAFTLLAAADALSHQVPERSQGEPIRQLMPTIVERVNADVGAATGRDGRYIVYWEEAVLSGSQGLALVNELERRGFRVGVDPLWQFAATPHRVMHPGEPTAALFLASGPWIEEYSARPGLVLLGEVDARTEEERRRFAQLQRAAVSRLRGIGRDDLVSDAERRIFALSTNPQVPSDVRAMLDEMTTLGVPVAVFIGPIG